MNKPSDPNQLTRGSFPSDFIFGTATSSYQIEGTEFGFCGQSHWDTFAQNGGTANRSDGAIACAHMTNWENDLDLIKECGLDAYRFSTAWPRIQPDGKGQIQSEGLDFYDALVDGLLERNIQPHLTLYHWDLPQTLADAGGWTNPDTARHFADYSATVADRLGDRLNSIATINEPWCVAWLSYFLGHHAPGLKNASLAAKAMHNILLAHGLGTSALRSQFSANSQCQLGIVLNMEYAQPSSDSEADSYAAQIQDGIYNRWFADAVFKGTYPTDVLYYLEPYLPANWQDDMEQISQPIDWLGLNYYTRSRIKDNGTGEFPFGEPMVPELNLKALDRTSMNWEIYPEGLSYFLQRIHDNYSKDIPLYVSENGMASLDTVENGIVSDSQRVDFFDKHLKAVKTAISNGVPVKGYFAWSLLDNFEWAFGYDQRFGIVHVDFENQTRTPKQSYHWLKNLMSS
jgi:beta-glucosidase